MCSDTKVSQVLLALNIELRDLFILAKDYAELAGKDAIQEYYKYNHNDPVPTFVKQYIDNCILFC